jgi:RNA polymerase sigma-70 factor (ECF subfamily)
MNETVRRAQQGDHAAFRTLYDTHVGRVYALCLRLAGNATEAEEHVQDVFVRVWERLGGFRGESAFSTWLHRLTVNEVLQARRTAGRRSARVTLVDDPADLDGAPATQPDRLASSDLGQAIGRLPDGARAVFVLHDVEGYQHDEIAGLLGIAEGTSKAQLFRARRLLREALGR